MALENLLCPTHPAQCGKRAKEKCTRDLDSNPSVVSRDVLEDTAVGVGESDTKTGSVGLNQNTRRAIHHKTRHKETFVNGQIQLRKVKVTASPKVRVKAKAKGKARENIQEKGTTTRTKLDLRMKKLDSAGWTILV